MSNPVLNKACKLDEQSIYQQTNTLSKLQFMTRIKLLHVSAGT